MVIRYAAAILYMVKADILFFHSEKLSKHLNILNFVIFYLDCEKSNAKFLSHMFQYSKILELA